MIQPRLIPLATLLATTSLALAACGGDNSDDAATKTPPATTATDQAEAKSDAGSDAGPSDKVQVRERVTAHMKAVFAGDGKTACAHATDAYRAYAVGPNAADGLDTCEKVVAKYGPESAKQYKAGSFKVSGIKINGDRATANTSLKAASGPDVTVTVYTLVRDGDDWLIDNEQTASAPPASE